MCPRDLQWRSLVVKCHRVGRFPATRAVHPRFAQCWTRVVDSGKTLNQLGRMSRVCCKPLCKLFYFILTDRMIIGRNHYSHVFKSIKSGVLHNRNVVFRYDDTYVSLSEKCHVDFFPWSVHYTHSHYLIYMKKAKCQSWEPTLSVFTRVSQR